MSGTKREREGKNMKALVSMLLVQVFLTGVELLSRVVLVQGTFIFALLTYRHIVATICIIPFALYFERDRPKNFNWRVWFWIFVNALVGMTGAIGFYYYGLRDTSATYAINFLNMVPICTFIVSVICRMENLRMQTCVGQAKCLGAILCVGGALVTSLYKGKEFYIHHTSHHHDIHDAGAHQHHMLRGTFFLILACCSLSAWFIAQVKLHKVFPLKYWGTMLQCLMAAIQAAIIGPLIDSSEVAWRLEWNLQLVTIVYSGALATAATFCLMSWVVSIKGPTYPPMFNPLALIFVAISEAILLGEPLKVGTILGMVIIIMGLYSFLWGKKNETPQLSQTNVAAAEVSTTMNDVPGHVEQSIAVVAPSSSQIELFKARLVLCYFLCRSIFFGGRGLKEIRAKGLDIEG